MPLATVTGGPTPPAGRTIAAGTLLTIHYDEPYSDGASTYPQTHEAEWDATNSRWKPLGSADGTTFQIPAGADGYPRPPGAWLTEKQVLDDASQQVSRRGPLRIYETTAGQWFYGSPASDAIFVSNPDVPGASAVLQAEVGAANGVASLDGAGDVPVAQIPDLSAIYAALTGATFTGTTYLDNAGLVVTSTFPFIQMHETDGTDPNRLRLAMNGNRVRFERLNDAGTYDGLPFYLEGWGGAQADAFIASRAIADYGSNANGEYVRFYNGVQIVWENYLTLTYNSAQELRNDWTFPAAFNSDDYALTATLRGVTPGTATSSVAANAAPSTDMIAHVSQGYITASSVALGVFRQNGKTDFVSGSEMYARAIAVGRWY